MPKKVRVGLVGCGFSAGLHMYGYRQLAPEHCEVVAVVGVPKSMADDFAAKHGIPSTYESFDEMLAGTEVDAVDLAVPNYLHAPFIIKAARAGKHVFCEKPLTGFFGYPATPEDALVGNLPKRPMLDVVMERCHEVVDAIKSSGIKFGYAENWVYAPSFVKLWRLAKMAGGTIIRVEAEESHSGSHAEYAKQWRLSGGGSLMVKGSHPLGAALELKAREGRAKFGKPIRAASVLCETGHLTWMDSFKSQKETYLRTGWKDVEDWGIVVVKFEDGSVAEVKAADTTLGGVHNYLEAYLSNARLRANINPTDSCVAYAPAPHIFGDEYIVEKIETKAGWTQPSPDEDWFQGYPQEIADYVTAIREDRQPLASWQLAREVMVLLYAAYVSAEEGRRVDVTPFLTQPWG
jgi:predicted dehydrogenase